MSDWKTDDDGDLVLERGDIAIATEPESVKQDIIFRLKTGQFDYAPDPEVAAGLDRFIGLPNTAETGSLVRQAVVRALTRNSAILENSLAVEVIPLSLHTIGIYVFASPQFSGIFDPINLAFTMDLTQGDITPITG